MSVFQKPISVSALKGIEWEEKVVRRSGRDCCIMCQKSGRERNDAGQSRRLKDIVGE